VSVSGDKNLQIRREDLGKVLKDVCKKEFTQEEVVTLFNMSDLNHSDDITFREFLIAVSVGYFLHVDHEHEEVMKIKSGFLAIKEAFSAIDKDNGGSIDFDELKQALFSSSMQDGELLEERFAELDFNHDKAIEFPEFVYAMISWVGFEEEHMERIEKKNSGKNKK